jgi:hypothetical protein
MVLAYIFRVRYDCNERICYFATATTLYYTLTVKPLQLFVLENEWFFVIFFLLLYRLTVVQFYVSRRYVLSKRTWKKSTDRFYLGFYV